MKTFFQFLSTIGLILLCAAPFVGIGYWIYNSWYYSPDRLETALEEYDFNRAHKIMNRLADDAQYNYEGLIFKEESKYSKTCKRVMSWEILYLVKEGAVDRIQEVAALYKKGDELLPEVMQSHASSIFKHLDKYTLDDLILLSKYYSLIDLTKKAIALNPTGSELLDFIRRASSETPSAVTGHVEKKDILDHNQYVNHQINQYNEACDLVLEYGLEKKDKELCNSLLSLYRDNLIIELTNSHTFTADEYNVYYRPDSRTRAERKIKSLK